MTRSIVLRGVDGSHWDLCDGPVQAGLDPQLWGSGAVQVTERTSAMLPGSRITNRRHQTNDLIVPLVVLDPTVYPSQPWTDTALADVNGFSITNGWPVDDLVDETGNGITDENDDVLNDVVDGEGGGQTVIGGNGKPFTAGSIEDTVAEFARAIDAVRGDVVVTVGRTDDTVREIRATYIGGWSQLSMRDRLYGYVMQGTIVLRATDPYWSAVSDQTITVEPPAPVFTEGTTGFSGADVVFSEGSPFNGFIVDDTLFSDPGHLFSEFIGFSGLGAGVRLFSFDNVGDVAAWPSYTVTGPASIVEVDNVTTGKRWRFNGLAAGDLLRVVTRPGEASVRVGRVNGYGRLVDGSSLWAFDRGDNNIAVRVDGATSATSFSMSWRPRYLTC